MRQTGVGVCVDIDMMQVLCLYLFIVVRLRDYVTAGLRDGAYLRPRPRRRVRREEDRPRRLKPNELPSEEERFPDLRD